MRTGPFKVLAICLSLSLLASGCILSRAVDRAFIGATVRKPSSPDRLATGLILLPFTAVIDLATFPIQAIIVAIVGDNFPFGPDKDFRYTMTASLEGNPRFKALSQDQQRVAIDELESLMKAGRLDPRHAAALGDDGHWVLVELDTEARLQALARANAAPAEPIALR